LIERALAKNTALLNEARASWEKNKQ